MPVDSKGKRGWVSASVLEALSEGLYENSLDVVREYVQNAYDAIGERFNEDYSKGLITITQERRRNSLIVHDNGCGMNHEDLESMVGIGFTNKGDARVGFRGIGSLAGFTVANKVIFVSKDVKSFVPYTATVDAEKINKICNESISGRTVLVDEVYDRCVSISETKQKYRKIFERYSGKSSSGTTVILEGIHNECGTLLSENLHHYIARRLPVDFAPDYEHATKVKRLLKKHVPEWNSVCIKLNGKDIRKPYTSGDDNDGLLRHKVVRNEAGTPLAYAWYFLRYGRKNNPIDRGLVLIVKGFTILEADKTISDILKFSTITHGYWVTGELHILSKGIVPTTSRGNLKDNEAKRRLVAHVTPWSRELIKQIRKRSVEQSAQRHDLKDFKRVERKIDSFFDKHDNGGVTPADIKEMRKVLSAVKKRTKERLKKIDPKAVVVVEELQETIKIVEKQQRELKKINATATSRKLGLKGVAKTVYNSTEKTVLKFPFQDYTKDPERLRADLMRVIYEEIRKIKTNPRG